MSQKTFIDRLEGFTNYLHTKITPSHMIVNFQKTRDGQKTLQTSQDVGGERVCNHTMVGIRISEWIGSLQQRH